MDLTRILVVSSHPLVAQIYTDTITSLTKNKHRYAVVPTPVERAWNWFTTFYDGGMRFNGAILDYEAPGLRPLGFLLALRRVDPKIKVLVGTSTGFGPRGRDWHRVIEEGAADTFEKPFRVRDLAKLVDETFS
jgi:DNA-binding NtrC family response regulator